MFINENHSRLNCFCFLSKSMNKCLLFERKKSTTYIFEEFYDNRTRILKHIRNSLKSQKEDYKKILKKIINKNKKMNKTNISDREKNTFKNLIAFQKKINKKKTCITTNYQK